MEFFLHAYYQIAAIILFFIGFYLLIVTPNLIKKILGINIMETAVFLFLISLGRIGGGQRAPILHEGIRWTECVNPLPQHMVILGVLMTLGVTGFALFLVVKIYAHYRTLNSDKLRRML
ncbi:MAG: NADH-quinone oxidoreductase subunit K [Candidatus Schekmanbacteria bacterium]|nr:NADH-quinone oxidoreductase subunit K [Candidatus Schekmanbacteria bacterium]